MNPIVLLVFVAVAVFVLAVLSGLTRRGSGRAPSGYPYGPQRALFTPAERSFLGVLEQATGEPHRIFGKVRLADVIKVNAGLTRVAWRTGSIRWTTPFHVLTDATGLGAAAFVLGLG